MKRTVLFIAMICAILAAFTASIFAAEYVGSSKCATCHSDIYKEWQKTKHGNMIQSAEVLGRKAKQDYKYLLFDTYIIDQNGNYAAEEWNAEEKTLVPSSRAGSSWIDGCASCHTTGLNNETKRFTEVGVACEACHGPGGDHMKTFSADDIISNPGNEMCSSCHGAGRQDEQMKAMTGAGHLGIFEEAITNESDRYSLRCAKCHSATVILSIKKGQQELTIEDFKTGELKDDRYGITCVVCHDPHQVTENEFQLRETKDFTCMQCHTGTSNFENPLPVDQSWANAPHHPQTEVLVGAGAVGVEQKILTHGAASCVTCHMTQGNHMFKPGTPEIALTSHGTTTSYNSCTGCHSSMTAARMESFQEEIVDKLEALTAKLDSLKAKAEGNDKALAVLKKAEINLGFVEADKSKGIHNPGYISAMLDAAGKFLSEAEKLL